MFSYLCSQISYLINLHKDLNLKLLGEPDNASIAGSGNNLAIKSSLPGVFKRKLFWRLMCKKFKYVLFKHAIPENKHSYRLYK